MRIYSIFRSIDGEVNPYFQGCPTVFIRFAGCNLQCSYCDTKYAQDIKVGKDMSVEEVVEEIKKYNIDKVTITGGEPLLQREDLNCLISKLRPIKITVETNGSIDLERYKHPMIPDSWIVDYKLPSSGCMGKMKNKLFSNLRYNDFVKFVVEDKIDYAKALQVMDQIVSPECKVAFSPVSSKLQPSELADWMIRDNIKAIFNLQIHKYIWPDCGEGQEK